MVVIALACSDHQPTQVRYETEKIYFQAQSLSRQATQTSGKAREQALAQSSQAFGQAMQMSMGGLNSLDSGEHPVLWTELQNLAFGSARQLVRIKFGQGQHDTCVSILNELLSRSQLTSRQNLISLSTLGQALQAAGLWDSAMSIYSTVQCLPPVDDSGAVIFELIDMPAHLFYLMDTLRDPQRDQFYDRALDYYQTLVTDYAGTPAAHHAHRRLASILAARKTWHETVGHWEAVAEGDTSISFLANLKIAEIFWQNLQSPDKANLIYEQLIADLGHADTIHLPIIRYHQARSMMHYGDYSASRQTFVDIRRKYPRFFDRTPAIQLGIAQSFERQSNWSRAESEYYLLIEKFHDSEDALEAYLYLADHSTATGLQRETDRWLADADTAYRKLASSSNPRLRARAKYFLARLSARNGQWQDAADQLISLFQDLPWTDPARDGLVWAIHICRNELGLSTRADSLTTAMKSQLTHFDNWEL